MHPIKGSSRTHERIFFSRHNTENVITFVKYAFLFYGTAFFIGIAFRTLEQTKKMLIPQSNIPSFQLKSFNSYLK